jgi:hypothetical protein
LCYSKAESWRSVTPEDGLLPNICFWSGRVDRPGSVSRWSS